MLDWTIAKWPMKHCHLGARSALNLLTLRVIWQIFSLHLRRERRLTHFAGSINPIYSLDWRGFLGLFWLRLQRPTQACEKVAFLAAQFKLQRCLPSQRFLQTAVFCAEFPAITYLADHPKILIDYGLAWVYVVPQQPAPFTKSTKASPAPWIDCKSTTLFSAGLSREESRLLCVGNLRMFSRDGSKWLLAGRHSRCVMYARQKACIHLGDY
jgi:hypothetical protein